jgi:pimeloyl-ACP methyl ester carboxylesterase
VQIAYATCGHGPLLVRAAHWKSHLRYDWESPVWRHWIEALSELATLIRYDQRGNGLSDREVSDFAFEAMVDDLQSVVEAAQLRRFTLLGVSQSCAVSVAYAARHPERLTGLILYGGFVKGWRARRNSHEIATHEAMTNLIREGWGMDNPAFRQLIRSCLFQTPTRRRSAVSTSYSELAWQQIRPAASIGRLATSTVGDSCGHRDANSSPSCPT